MEKYPQTKTDEQPQAKTEGQKPPYVWRPIFAGAFQELLSHSWLQNLLIGLALLLIWPLIGATFWRWFYRAPDKTPRGLTPYCPECKSETEMLFKFLVPRQMTPTMKVVPFLRMWCPLHPQHKLLPAEINEDFDDFREIKKLIVARLEDGSWEEVVAAKRQARGR